MSEHSTLVKLSQAERLLAEATVEDLSAVTQVKDLAEAARVYARRAQLGTQSINHATRIKVLSERKVAELVDRGQAEGQIATNRGRGGNAVSIRSADTKPPATLSDIGVSAQRLQEARVLAKIPAAKLEQKIAAANDEDREISRSELLTEGRKHDPAYSSEATTGVSSTDDYDSDEWYTPMRYVEAAREVMGAIDLDPASCEHAQQSIRAGAFYTKDEDGLAQPWTGRVWLNPPYSQPAASQFAQKLMTEFAAGRVTHAVMVQNASTDTAWFHEIASQAHLCLTKGRINFDRFDGSSSANRYGQVFFYLGPNAERFESVFSAFGLTGRLRG